MANVFDHLHLKRNTAGSSNELSFDVLDAARSGIDNKKSKGFGRSQEGLHGSYEGVGVTLAASRNEEVEKRKKERKARSIRSSVFVAIMFGTLFCVLAWFAYQHYEKTQVFSHEFQSVIEEFKETDAVLAQIDVLMLDPLNSDQAEDRKKAFESIPSAQERIVEASSKLETISEHAITEKDEMALNQTLEAANARLDMLALSESTFTISSRIEKLSERAYKTWSPVISADQAAKEATGLANRASSEEEIKASQKETVAAKEELQSIKKDMQELQEKQPDLKFKPYLEYVDAKIQALDYAIKTADCLIDGNREEAQKNNQLYNEADAKAADIAETLPRSLDAGVYQIYASKLELLKNDYALARNRTVAADSIIREYLNIA